MPRGLRIAIVSVVALVTIAAAGGRAPYWEKVRDALSKGLPKTALESLDPIISGAQDERAYAEAIRAITIRIALEAGIQGNRPEEKIARMRAAIERAPAPMRPVMEAILADWYWQYFQQNRWRFLGRSRTAAPPDSDLTTWDLPRLFAEIDVHFRRALAAAPLLQRTPVRDYTALFFGGNAPDAWRPTLYDLVAFEALDFYASGEQAGARPEDAFVLQAGSPALSDADAFVRWSIVTPDSAAAVVRALRLYQDLLRFHARDRDPGPRIDADLWRLAFAHDRAAGPTRDERYAAALDALAERYARHELSARALHELAELRRAQGDLVEARRLARLGVDRFPESVGGRRCFNLIQDIEARSLAVTASDNVWNDPAPTLEVRYRNLDQVHFRLVPFDFAAEIASRTDPTQWFDRGRMLAILARPVARSWSARLAATPDFHERRERVSAPADLPSGPYYLVASASPDFRLQGSAVAVSVVWVSRLALVVRPGRPAGLEGFVLRAGDGAPVAGASVRTWLWARPSGGSVPGPSFTTDAKGMFRIADTEGLLHVLVSDGDQQLGESGGFPTHRFDPPLRVEERTLFFTDRALYRPGQTIRYKGLCIRTDPERDDYATLASRMVRAVLRDVNGREVASAVHRLNDRGSFAGAFTAPADGLLGAMSLGVTEGPVGWATVNVEEYKRPRFLVTLEAPRAAVRLDGAAEVPGRALAYTGAPVDGAAVRWRVVRAVRYPDWWGWRFWWCAPSAGAAQEIAHGTSITDAEGRFAVSFVTHPDSTVAREQEPVFRYDVFADVTDGAGETRSARRTMSAGYTALVASLAAPEWLVAARPVEVTLRTTTLDGAPAVAAGTLRVLRLREPGRVTRARPAEEGQEESVRPPGGGAPPPEVDAANATTWSDGDTIAVRPVTTDSAGVARVALRLAPGLYRARLETHDRFGQRVTALLPLRVLDPGAPRCPLEVADLFVQRATSVEVGETYEAVWGTGYPTGRAYVEVEHRGRLLQAFWTDERSTQVRIRQRVDAAMRGGFMVRVTRVGENRAYLHEQFVTVPWSDRVLTLRWEHFVSKLQPGGRETWTAVVSGPDATRVAAEMVATLYDASLDALAPLAWPGIGGFRSAWDPRPARSSLGPRPLQSLEDWPRQGKDGSLAYRSLPPGLLWGDYRYGLLGMPGVAPAPPCDSRPDPDGARKPRGRITGTVYAGSAPAAHASVVVTGARLGAVTDERGRYTIAGLPAGRWCVEARTIGWAAQTRSIRVRPGQAVSLDFRLSMADVVKQEESIQVSAGRPIDTKSSTTKQTIEGFRYALPAAKAGIVSAEELHVRGGRSGEMQFDGVEVGDLDVAAPDLDQVVARRNLTETAFFFPQLTTDASGAVRMEFTMPEGLTTWRFLGFAHDRALRSGLLEARAVTAKDLMVQPNPPRFLREGDEVEFTVKITNLADSAQRGAARLTFTRASDGVPVDAALGIAAPEQPFEVPARASRTCTWRLRVPDGAGVLAYDAVAATARLSDGEAGYVPVLARRVLVTESLPLPIRGPASRTFDFEHLRRSGESATLVSQSLTVQMVSNPAWYAVMALPYLIESPFECSDQIFDRLYANALARHVAESDPRIRAVFDRWRGTPALDSPLEKNEDLKSVTIAETPWLRQARAESQARRDVGILFEKGRLDRETNRALDRLARMQLPDGAWPWFPGGLPNDYVTLAITTGFGRLRHLGVDVSMGPAYRALDRLDGWSDRMYRDVLRWGRPDDDHLSPIVALYLYGRSFFLTDRPVAPPYREALDYWLSQARRHWLAHPERQMRAHLALALQRFGDPGTARAILRSVKEYAVTDDELGMFWRDTELSWWWYRAPIETQAMMIEAFDEVMHDSVAVEDCKVWLLKQKQTQDWKTTRATADAVYALLLRGAGPLASDARVDVSLGDSLIVPEKVEAGTGFYEHRFAAAAIGPALAHVRVRKSDAGVAWGSVHWQYLEDMEKVPPYAGTPLRIEKALFVRRNGRAGPELVPVDGPVRVGDELVARITLRTDRDMEYVHLKDCRGSGVEPVNVLSGYRYQDGLRYYEETRDVASHFFIDYLPKGTYVFEVPERVQLRGRYGGGIAEVQCMYAPEFNGHSASVALVVE